MKKRCIRCTLKTNRFQKQYLNHHMCSTRYVYQSVCRTLHKEQMHRTIRSTKEIKGLCKQHHREYMKVMDENEVMAMVHQLLHYQWCLRQTNDATPSTYFACTITSPKLVWRKVCLENMLTSQSRARISQGEFLYARLFLHKQRLQLHIYIRLPTKS